MVEVLVLCGGAGGRAVRDGVIDAPHCGCEDVLRCSATCLAPPR